MQLVKIGSVLALLSTLVSAGNVYVDNFRCRNRVYVTSYANQDPPSGGLILFPPNTYTEVQRGPNLGNNTIELRTDGSPGVLVFGYAQNIVTGRLYFSFDTSRGDPFRDFGYEVITNGGHLGILCPPSPVTCPYSRANFSAGPVYNVANGADFTVRLCQYDGPP